LLISLIRSFRSGSLGKFLHPQRLLLENVDEMLGNLDTAFSARIFPRGWLLE
jgi:hypothetical protein